MKVRIDHGFSVGMKTHDVPEASTLEEAAMAVVRESHPFLADHEHEMEVEDLGPEYGNATYVRVYKLPRSEPPPQAAITPAIFRKFAGDPWFSVRYAEAGGEER